MKRLLVLTVVSLITMSGAAQSANDVFVDKNGVMRWGKSKAEVYGFGVNYTTMFAHAYRTAKKLNIPIEKAIDDDVYHFSRLGFDLFRVHVWDTEISDTLGNLLQNENLRLFDYALVKMKERGMNFIITPIAFWGNGWPGPDDKTPGFARKYGKDVCLTNEGAIKAQENYLAQFLNHVNQYSKVAYKNDPTIIAFEISNEPHHQEGPEKVTPFINRMAKAMRSTGCKKPIFYNVSHSIHLADAYAAADIQGGTFQWYPTGLGFRRELRGNLLPNVDLYNIPFWKSPDQKRLAKIVYEFDAADVGRSYIYPAMARSFREAGIQVATHFAYDPTFMADVNTEYVTHYMNLPYAPQKALSLKIASAVFHQVPMNKRYGGYPANVSFENFSVSYESDLALLNSETEFFYTNHTTTPPKSPDKLEHVAGAGNSPVVSYEGTGAYFLDRVSAGVWRLEVMPDVVWITDPFNPTGPSKQVAVINWQSWPIKISLSVLGNDFQISGLNDGNAFKGNTQSGSFSVSPGTYLLTKEGTSSKVSGTDRSMNLVLKEFSAPATTVKKTYVLHQPVAEISAGSKYSVEATIIAPKLPSAVEIHIPGGQGRRPEVIAMKREKNYQYRAEIPVQGNFLNYYIVTKGDEGSRTFPVDALGEPREWSFYDRRPYSVRVIPTSAPLYLFDAVTDADELARAWARNSALNPIAEPGKAELSVNIEKLFVPDPENRKGPEIADYSMRYFFGKKIAGRGQELAAKKTIIVSGRSLNDKPCPIQVALILNDGSAFGGIVKLEPGQQEYSLSVSDLKEVKIVTLPRPYPTFLSYFFTRSGQTSFDPSRAEALQISLGPGLDAEGLKGTNGFVLRSIRVE